MATSVRPFLMFEGRAEEAMDLYVSLFSNAKVLELARYGPEGPGKEGSIVRASFSIAGQTVMCIDSPAAHAFTFTPASSLFVECESDDELEKLFSALSEGGQIFMPLDTYGFSRRFGWAADRFGVSWQLNLA